MTKAQGTVRSRCDFLVEGSRLRSASSRCFIGKCERREESERKKEGIERKEGGRETGREEEAGREGEGEKGS